MTQVTDEMLIAAEDGWSLADNNECSPKECWRAALESALAVRGETRTVYDPFTSKDAVISNRLVDRLRGKYAVGPTMQNGEPEFGWQQHETPPIQYEAADLIERQALEIARLVAKADEVGDTVVGLLLERESLFAERASLTAERAELIEALREMVDTQQSWEDSVSKIVGRPVIPFARAIDRARALIERIGAKEVVPSI